MTATEQARLNVAHVAKVAARSLLFRARRRLDHRFRDDNESPAARRALEECNQWLVGYMGKPHPELGRSGDVCPFVLTSMNRGRMSSKVYPELEALSVRQLSDLTIHEALELARRLEQQEPDWELTAVNLLFPNLRTDFHENLEGMHRVCKTLLMRRGMMLAVFFPGSPRPGFHNPSFQLYQSKFPIVTLRPMALHDISFVEKNPFGFAEYRRLFRERYASGKVSAKFGYVERFADAERRYGYR